MRTSLLLAVLTLSLASCTSTRPNVFNRAEPVPVAAPCPDLDSLAKLPAYLVPAPAGSTPRQRRQWQKAQTANLARAGVLPTKVKNSSLATGAGSVATTVTRPAGAVATGAGSSATSITKPQAPVATGAGSATDNSKAGQRGGAAATAPDAVATATTERGLSWWWLLLVALLAGLIVNKVVRGRWLL